jgi:formylglycine-generating enzyme required for sulfatase activity
MGAPEPADLDEEDFVTQIHIGRAVLAMSVGALAVMVAFVISRAAIGGHRPQISLARLLVLALVSGVGVMGGLHWLFSERRFAEAKTEHAAAVARFTITSEEERPVREVTIPKPFYFGKYEVTQDQYAEIMGANPSRFKGYNQPADMVSWEDAKEFCKRASERTGLVIRMPTEAEWEYACRAGTHTSYSSGDTVTALDRVAWYRANAKGRTHPVGTKDANTFGLHDMHGNLIEWCEDAWYRYDGTEDNRRHADWRVLRGGSWNCGPQSCSSSGRTSYGPGYGCSSFGFRVVVAFR